MKLKIMNPDGEGIGFWLFLDWLGGDELFLKDFPKNLVYGNARILVLRPDRIIIESGKEFMFFNKLPEKMLAFLADFIEDPETRIHTELGGLNGSTVQVNFLNPRVLEAKLRG
jgi:hypothetical protein